MNYLNQAIMSQSVSTNPIYQLTPHQKTSKVYNFVNTNDVISFMESKGYEVGKTSIARSKVYAGYQKHIVRFRPINIMQSLNLGQYFPEIVIINDHHASRALQVMLGIYRMVCANGLIAGESLFSEKIRHTGFTYEKLNTALNNAINAIPLLLSKVNAMESTQCSYEQAVRLAQAALSARGIEDTSNVEIVHQLFKFKRSEDNKKDLFTVMNVIQENITRYPIRYHVLNKDSGAFEKKTTRRITSIDVDTQVNKVLFEEALRIAA